MVSAYLSGNMLTSYAPYSVHAAVISQPHASTILTASIVNKTKAWVFVPSFHRFVMFVNSSESEDKRRFQNMAEADVPT